ncbi:MAG: class II aldolase/adducin family protein [Thermofilaceae archaeon]
MRYLTERERIVTVFRLMEEKNLNYGYSGNVSVRVSENEYLISPTGARKASMKPEDVLLVNEEGEVLEGTGQPSVELPLHVTVYKNRQDVRAIIHAHPIYATVLGVLRVDLEPVVEELAIYVGGGVKVADYAIFGSQELANNVVGALGDRSAVIMANHGILTCGRDIMEAFDILVCVERAAQVYVLARAAGIPNKLPSETIKAEVALYKLRKSRSS